MTQLATRLASGVSTKNAQVGQPVLADLIKPAQLANGKSLPTGSQLMGHVSDVKSLSSGSGTSSLKMLFDKAKFPDGHTEQIQSLVQGVGQGKASEQTSADASATQNTSGGGGLLGAVGGVVSGTVKATGSLLGVVTGLPGVLLDSTGTLNAKGKNIDLASGTQVTVAVSAQ